MLIRGIDNTMIDKKIIRSWFGGLGDNLQHSWMPAAFSKLGYSVYVSNEIPYRNPEIKQFVWGLNPFVDGFTDEPANCGDIPGVLYHDYGLGCIGNWQKVHGIEPTEKYPIVYYLPSWIQNISHKVLVDATSTSGQNIYESEKIRKYLQDHYNKEEIEVCVFSDGIFIPMLLLDGYTMRFVGSLNEYADLIHSCKKYVTLHAGGMVLASALKRNKNIDCDCLVTFHPIHINAFNSKHYFFDNINYIWI